VSHRLSCRIGEKFEVALDGREWEGEDDSVCIYNIHRISILYSIEYNNNGREWEGEDDWVCIYICINQLFYSYVLSHIKQKYVLKCYL
jgi:hypothetical protein